MNVQLLFLNIFGVLAGSMFVLSVYKFRSKTAYLIAVYVISYADVVLTLESAGLFAAVNKITVLFLQIQLTACGFLFWLPLSRIKIAERFRVWIDKTLEGWRLIGQNRAVLLKLLGLKTGEMLLLAVRYWVAFQMLSQDMSIGQVVLLSSASILTQLISIAPGGLGMREAFVGGIASTLGFDLTVRVAAVQVDRVVATLTIILEGWISTAGLAKQISDKSVKSNGQEL